MVFSELSLPAFLLLTDFFILFPQTRTPGHGPLARGTEQPLAHDSGRSLLEFLFRAGANLHEGDFEPERNSLQSNQRHILAGHFVTGRLPAVANI